MEIKVKSMGTDFWDREIFIDVESGDVYKLVDGCYYTANNKGGEPECPVRKDVKITVVK